MFNIDFYAFGALDVRRDEPELDLDIPLNSLFSFGCLTEDMLMVHFKDYGLDVSCFGYIDAWNDEPNYSIETFKKIIFVVGVYGKEYEDFDNPELIVVCRYLNELKEGILTALDFIKKVPKNNIGIFDIDFSPGFVVINRPQINLDISFEYLVYVIRDEKILKVCFSENLFLESGWVCLDKNFDTYDENNWTDILFTKGYFYVRVIKDNDMTNLIFYKECKNLVELKGFILEALSFVKEKADKT